MELFDPLENVQKDYNEKLCYNHWVSAALSKGGYHIVIRFLQQVPDRSQRGKNSAGFVGLS